MNHVLSSFFQKINILDHDRIDIYQSHFNKNNLFKLIRFHHHRDLFRPKRIYVTPWGDLCYCYYIAKTETIKDAKEDHVYILSDYRTKLFKKYGPFDVTLFFKICGILVSIKNDKDFKLNYNIDVRYTNPRLVVENSLYTYFNYNNKYIEPLDKTIYFKNQIEQNLVFDPIYIDPIYLKKAYNLKFQNTIDFILSTTGFVRHLKDNLNVIQHTKHPNINTVAKLRYFILHSKEYAKYVKDILKI